MRPPLSDCSGWIPNCNVNYSTCRIITITAVRCTVVTSYIYFIYTCKVSCLKMPLIAFETHAGFRFFRFVCTIVIHQYLCIDYRVELHDTIKYKFLIAVRIDTFLFVLADPYCSQSRLIIISALSI